VITNWKALVLCILAACIFWFLNAMNRHKYTDDIWYPIEISYDESKVVPVAPLPDKIKVNATGEGWNFFRKAIRFNVVPITYVPHDLPRRKYITARELLPVAEKQIEGIHINYIIDDTLKIDFDYIETKKVYLKLDVSTLSLAPNFNLTGPVEFKPAFVKFTGPRKRVRNLPDSILIGLSYKNIKGNFEQIMPVNFPTDAVIKKDLDEVTLSFKTAQFFAETVNLVPEFVNVPKGIKIARNKVAVTFFVTEKDKDRFGPSDFRVQVDMSKSGPDNATGTAVVLDKPKSVSNISVNLSPLKVSYEN
jgi:hypothetical protein